MRRLLWLAGGMALFTFLLLPLGSQALTATNVTITPTATDITSSGDDDPNPPPEGTDLHVFDITIGETYVYTATVDAEPCMMVITGGLLDSWSFDEATMTVTGTMEGTGYVEGSGNFGNVTPMGVALVPIGAENSSDPPAQMATSWMSTNIMMWNLVPPSEDAPYFGYELSGPDGATGFFEMYAPDSTLEMLSEIAGETLTWDDMAMFANNNQATLNIEEVDGGAEVSIQVTFKSNVNKVTTAMSADIVSKSLLMKEQLPLSLALAKKSAKREKTVRGYGWLKTGKKDKKITILKKKKGKKYKTFRTVRTKANGRYTFKIGTKKVGVYYYKAQIKKKKSPRKRFRVKK